MRFLENKKESSGQFSCALNLTQEPLSPHSPSQPAYPHAHTIPLARPNVHWESESVNATDSLQEACGESGKEHWRQKEERERHGDLAGASILGRRLWKRLLIHPANLYAVPALCQALG